MALRLALMIEGQEGLTWEHWRRLARTAEDGGFDSLFRSDHLTGLFGDSRRPSLDTWASLTWLATATRRIRFGPLVSPLTFHHPALLAKRAAALAEDRKSTRLNSSHLVISYAVFCLKKKN